MSFGDPDEAPLLERDVMQCIIRYPLQMWSVQDVQLFGQLLASAVLLRGAHKLLIWVKLYKTAAHASSTLPSTLLPYSLLQLPHLKTLSFGDPASAPSPSE